MWYWLSVYALVVVAVAVPVLLLYLVDLLLRLTVAATRFTVRNLRTAVAGRKESDNTRWTAIWRKAA
jgi:hypothetical protein